jgi:hypothetical protein
MDLKEIGWENVDWFHLAQGRKQDMICEHDNESFGSIKGEEFLE